MYYISAVKQMIITPSRLNERHKYFHIKSGFAATFVAVVAVVLTFHFASKRLWTWISYFSEPNPIIKHDIVYFKESFIVFFCLAEMNHNDLKPLSLWIWITEVDRSTSKMAYSHGWQVCGRRQFPSNCISPQGCLSILVAWCLASPAERLT